MIAKRVNVTAPAAECRPAPEAIFAPRPSDLARIESAAREMLVALGEDPSRDGLRVTPSRVARALNTELFAGLREDLAEHLCMTMCGARSSDARMTAMARRGILSNDETLSAEVLSTIYGFHGGDR